MSRRGRISMVLAAALVGNLLSGVTAMADSKPIAKLSDASAHWAAKPIERWVKAGIMQGYDDGQFHPDEPVTRAQMAVMLNGLFGFSKKDSSVMTDVAAGAWYADALSKAKAAGYMKGYPDQSMHPGDTVSRQDAAVMITRVLQLNGDGSDKADQSYTDQKKIASYAAEAIRIMAAQGYLSGYSDGSIRPGKALTRAEMAALLDKTIGLYVSEQGSFESESGQGSAILNAPGLELKDRKISGSLFITERVADGNVTLDHVTVADTSIVKGGGANSIHINDSTLGDTVVDRPAGTVRLVASGSSTIGRLSARSDVILEESALKDGAGFTDIDFAGVTGTGNALDMSGVFGHVTLSGAAPDLELQTGSIDQLSVDSVSTVTTNNQTSVRRLDVTEQGSGSTFVVRGSIEQTSIQGPITVNNSAVQKGNNFIVLDGTLRQGQAGGGPVFVGGGGGAGTGGSGTGSGPGQEDVRIDLIGDGDFTSGLGRWKAFWGNDELGVSSGTLTAVDGEMKASLLTAGDSPGSMQVVREGLALTGGTIYTVSFDARASVSRKINVSVSDGTKEVATVRTFALTPDKQTYSYSFTMQANATASGKLSFLLGDNGEGANAPADVYFDNVKLTASQSSIVDKKALNGQIEAAYKLNELDYTPASWSLFNNALITAKEASFSNAASKTEVDQAQAGLSKAMSALVQINRAAGLASVSITDNDGNDLSAQLTPAFRADKFNYLIGVRSNAASVSIDPVLAANNTLKAVAGANGAGGQYSAAVKTGKNEVTFTVSEAGKADAVYHFYFVKEQAGDVRRDPSDWELTWADEFNGDAIDESKWNFVNQGGGFGNRELEYYTPRTENARIEPIDGDNKALVIEARKEKYEGHDYTSAKLYSQNKGDWTYGRYEIRAKMPKSQGIWPAIWMMPTDYDLYGPWPSTGEIDIMEMIGNEPNKAWGTLHYGLPWKYSNASFDLPGTMDYSQDYHTFSIEWEPGEIRWYVDGIFYQRQNDWYSKRDGESAPLTWPAPFDQNFYIQLNVAVGGDWPQFPDSTTIVPSQMMVDYVRVYKLKDGLEYRDPGPGPDAYLNPSVPTPRPETGAGGLIYNGTFDQGEGRMGFWEFATDNTAVAGYNIDPATNKREFRVSFADQGDSPESVQLSQPGVPLVQGKQYKLTFKARSSEGATIQAQAVKASDSSVKYSGAETFAIGTEMNSYSYIFTMNQATDNNARMVFNLGGNTSDIYIDNVALTTYYPPLFQNVDITNFANQQGYTVQDGAVSPDDSGKAWMQYNVNVPATGDYVLTYRAATTSDSALLTFKGAEPNTRTIHLPNTGGAWQTVSDIVHLNAGTQMVLLSGTGYRLDQLTIAPNSVRNGSMDQGTEQWELWNEMKDGVTLSSVNGQTKLAIDEQGSDFWGTQFMQKGVPLYKGKTYRVSFEARSTVSRKLRLTIDDPITNGPYALYDSVNLTTQWKTYSFDFTMTGTTNLNSRIDFNLGKIAKAVGPHEVYLDQVKFMEIPAVEQASAVNTPVQIDVPGNAIDVQAAEGLTGLTVSAGKLSPSFDAAATEYTVKVPANVESFTLVPALAPDNTIVSVGGAGPDGAGFTAAHLNDGENVISFIINEPGHLPKAYTIHVIRTPHNLLLGKNVTVSSGSGASRVVDGLKTNDSRWESEFKDPQWLMVDMGDLYNLSNVTLDWESARAKTYSLEVSQDGAQWIEVHYTTTGSGPQDMVNFADLVTARYIRMTGTERNTAYGYSLYEISASGEPVADQNDIRAFKGKLAKQIDRLGSLVESDYTADSWLAAASELQAANTVRAAVSASQSAVDEAASRLQASIDALVKLTKADGLTGLGIDQGALSPQFNMDVLNYRVVLSNDKTSINFTTVLAAGNELKADGVTGAVLQSPGMYQADLLVGTNDIFFSVTKDGAQLSKTYHVQVVRLPVNIAIGKIAAASSGNGADAVDGNGGTRWIASAQGTQWIYVDLGVAQSISGIQLNWETASAKTYVVQVADANPNDESSWTTVASFNPNGDMQLGGGERSDYIAAAATAQYVRVLMTVPNTPWNYSIYEFQVFGN